MQPVYIEPFIKSAIKIIKKTTGVDAYKKSIYVKKGKNSLGGVGIVLNVEGDISGKVAYEFSRDMTMTLASKMIKKGEVPFENKDEFQRLLKSSMAELGNVISGHSITDLLSYGYNCYITPPKYYSGQGIPLIYHPRLVFVIELTTEFGDFVINLSLKQNAKCEVNNLESVHQGKA